MIKAIYAIPRIAIAHPLQSNMSAKGSGRNLLISINTYSDGMLITEPGHVVRLKELGYIDHLSLAFADCTAGELHRYRMAGNIEIPGFMLFSYDDGRAVKAFIDKWMFETLDRLVIHCDKGQSRSGAVAAWAFYYLSGQGLYGKTKDQFWADNREISPNEHVAKILCEVSGITFREEDF
jgi:predicted protein tyrosine phosphatase